MKKYSIILPVRNGGAYVKECVQSILSQTCTDFTLQVLDNCSTDGTIEWIKGLNDNRIEYYPAKKPLSIEENWGRIAAIPKNEFITLIGHDDILLPHYLEEMDVLIKKHPAASLYQTHFDYIDENGRILKKCKPMDEIQYAHEFVAMHFLQILDSTGTGYLMRSGDYDALGGIPVNYPGFIFADYELWVNLIEINYKATSAETCFQYRINNNTSKNMDAIKYQDSFIHYIDFLEKKASTNQHVKKVIYNYGISFLNFYTQALSHRLLKQHNAPGGYKVKTFINKVIEKAKCLELNGKFQPYREPLIRVADKIDALPLGRKIFQVYKSIKLKKKN